MEPPLTRTSIQHPHGQEQCTLLEEQVLPANGWLWCSSRQKRVGGWIELFSCGAARANGW